jgi:tRNA/tmRNA/rRNA uracil-C5-methylase (TrmA/RlmC/RlmD family)
MTTATLEITTMAHGGSGIGRLDGRVVFCPGVIPGEVVEVELVETSKKSLWRAQPIKIISASEHRVPHIWPEADVRRPWPQRAGGADYGHIALSHQRELKTGILQDSLRRFGNLEGDLVDNATVQGVPGDDERGGLHWRTRVTLHANEAGELGPYAERSRTVIPVSGLPLASQPIGDSGVLATKYVGSTTVRALDTGGSGVRLVVDKQTPADIVERVGDVEFALSDHSFWQVHQQAPAILSGAVTRAIRPERLVPRAENLDLYSGVGLLGHALASISPERVNLTAVESDELATKYVGKNLDGIADVTAVSAQVHRWLESAVQGLGQNNADSWRQATVILDPPRSGANSEVISSLADLGVATIIYVACDPVALGRDAGLLAQVGYELVFLEAWDLFPHTHHMESIATFIRT